MIKLPIYLSFSLLAFATSLTGQITLNNGSFEGEPQDAIVPMGWQGLIIEARSMDGLYFSYNGNILLDNISVLKPCYRAENVKLEWIGKMSGVL